MRRIAIAVSAIALSLGIGVVAVAAIPDADGNVYACYNKQTGAVRLIDKSETCRTIENRTHWASAQRAVQKTYVVEGPFVFFPANDNRLGDDATANCRAGDVATGGGATDHNIGIKIIGEQMQPQDDDDRPINPPTGFLVQYSNFGNDFASFGKAYVVCLEAQ
jgi:hypothetical protein